MTVYSFRNFRVYVHGSDFLSRSYDTRQRDYRKADTDVGADVNETAGHFGTAGPAEPIPPTSTSQSGARSLAAP